MGTASESAAGLKTLKEPSEVIALIYLTTKLQYLLKCSAAVEP